MARKAKSSFNMSAEVRNQLKSNKNLSGPQVYAALVKAFPKQKINKNSCQVAFTMARRKLGLTGKGATKRVYRKVAKPSADTVSLSALRSARELLSRTNGDVALATAILKEVQSLQA